MSHMLHSAILLIELNLTCVVKVNSKLTNEQILPAGSVNGNPRENTVHVLKFTLAKGCLV